MTTALMTTAPSHIDINEQMNMANRKTRVTLCMSRPIDLDAYGCLIELVAHARVVVRTNDAKNLIPESVSSKSGLIVADFQSIDELDLPHVTEHFELHKLQVVVIAHPRDDLGLIEQIPHFQVVNNTHDLVRLLRSGEIFRLDPTFDLPESVPPSLTSREREVWGLIAIGQSVSEVAMQLGLAESTIDSHKSKLMKKLNVRKSIDLTRLAIRLGIVEL